MASNIPTIKLIAWISMIPQLILMGLLIYVFYLLGFKDPLIFGPLTYLIVGFVLRNIVAKSHRQGIRLVKQKKFSDAIPFFEKSVNYFTQNKWVDKYRYITLLSSSKMTYKEMGLCNIAFSYSQLGNGQKAKEYYERTIQEFPKNGMAIAALNMLNSATQKSEMPT